MEVLPPPVQIVVAVLLELQPVDHPRLLCLLFFVFAFVFVFALPRLRIFDDQHQCLTVWRPLVRLDALLDLGHPGRLPASTIQQVEL
jgi:hypothetical protein